MAPQLVSQTPANNTLGWDPAQPMRLVWETNTGTMRTDRTSMELSNFTNVLTNGVPANDNPAGTAWQASQVLSNGGTRLTLELMPVGGWQPSANYGAGLGPVVLYLLFWDVMDTAGNQRRPGYDTLRFTTGPAQVVATDPAAVSLCIEPARFAPSRS